MWIYFELRVRRRRRRRRHFCWSIKCHPIGRYICIYIKFKAHPVGAADWAHDILSTWLVVVEESGLRFFQEHHESIQFSYRERETIIDGQKLHLAYLKHTWEDFWSSKRHTL